MKPRGMMLVIIVGCLIAGVAGAQMPAGMPMAPKTGQAKKGMMAEGMRKKCQAMMAGREEMMAKMKAMASCPTMKEMAEDAPKLDSGR